VDFTEPVVLVLTSLADGPKHGYALAKDIEWPASHGRRRQSSTKQERKWTSPSRSCWS